MHIAIVNKVSGEIRMVLCMHTNAVMADYKQFAKDNEDCIEVANDIYAEDFRKTKKYDFNSKNWIKI